MSAVLPEDWLQSVVQSIQLPAVSPTTSRILLPVVESHIRRILQHAHKFQRRGKGHQLTVEDINLALSMNKIDQVYGFKKSGTAMGTSSSTEVGSIIPSETGGNSGGDAAEDAVLKITMNSNGKEVIDLVELSKIPLPPCPLKPEVSLHWLAVQGAQPQIPENPSVQTSSADEQPLDLPKELQHLYARITGIVLTDENGPALQAVYHVLRTDLGLQELTPYLSRFCYQQIRRNTKRLSLLQTIIRVIRSLMVNRMVNLEFHLQQLLPAIFTCVVAAKLSIYPSEDHWSLRQNAAELVAVICSKYIDIFPDLQARVCKTYLEALGAGDDDTNEEQRTQRSKRSKSGKKSLSTVYGGIIGLSYLGNTIIRSILLTQLNSIQNRLREIENKYTSGGKDVDGKIVGSKRTMNADETTTSVVSAAKKSKYERMQQLEELTAVGKCREALTLALGKFFCHFMKLPSISAERQAARVAIRKIKMEPDVQQGTSGTDISSDRKHSRLQQYEYPLCDLEESLIPYYVSASKQDYYCRLFL